MITRKEALDLLHQEIPQPNLIKHVLAVEAVMTGLARRLGGDEEVWSRAGLLHDLDYAHTMDNPERHGRMSVEMLTGRLPQDALQAILAHCGHIEANTAMDKAIRCADPVTGLIVAAALMHPDRKLASVDVHFLLKRFKEKRFAAGADREQIAECRNLGLELEEFLSLALMAMQGASQELGL